MDHCRFDDDTEKKRLQLEILKQELDIKKEELVGKRIANFKEWTALSLPASIECEGGRMVNNGFAFDDSKNVQNDMNSVEVVVD